MAISREKKKEILKKLEAVAKSPAAAFVNFHGLSVAKMTELRKRLRGEEVGLIVAKKTLIKKALTDARVPGELPALDGEVAIAFAKTAVADTLAPARGVYQFEKDNKGSVRLLGGLFEGKLAGETLIMTLATIPGRETLYAQLVGLLASPMRSLAVVLNERSKTLK